MEAVILAGGKGTRLKPYTVAFPKPLVPLGDQPILEIIIRQLSAFGVKRVTISTGHMAELISAYFGDGSRWKLRINYVREETPLNTAGALKLISPADENFIVMNGDVLTNLDLSDLFQSHVATRAEATIATCVRESKIDFGVVEVNEQGRLTGYQEKPVHSFPVSMGIYVMNRRCSEFIVAGESIGMPDLLMRLVKAGSKVQCHQTNAYWLDIGRVDDYERAQEEFETNKGMFAPR